MEAFGFWAGKHEHHLSSAVYFLNFNKSINGFKVISRFDRDFLAMGALAVGAENINLFPAIGASAGVGTQKMDAEADNKERTKNQHKAHDKGYWNTYKTKGNSKNTGYAESYGDRGQFSLLERTTRTVNGIATMRAREGGVGNFFPTFGTVDKGHFVCLLALCKNLSINVPTYGHGGHGKIWIG